MSGRLPKAGMKSVGNMASISFTLLLIGGRDSSARAIQEMLADPSATGVFPLGSPSGTPGCGCVG